MTRLLLATGLALAVAAGAWAVVLREDESWGHRLTVGALEDSVKWIDPQMADDRVELGEQAGFNALNVTTAWEPGVARPTDEELTLLRNVAQAAERRNMQMMLTAYALRPRFAPISAQDQQTYAGFMATLARELPSVRHFAVWNEPNLNGFWLYQYGDGGENIAAPFYTALLARTYDALKKVSSEIKVYGGNLAPRGFDNPGARRETQSPVGFIREMGKAYRASRRAAPLMDIFAIHPYLERSAIPPTKEHPIGTSVGFADYEKLVRVLGEAFDGTAQPGSELPIAYTEFGVQSQIPEAAQAPYTNLQSPLGRDAVPEATQAEYYRQALELSACQETVVAVYFFHLFDEADLNRWQSGPYYTDTRPKSSRDAIREAAEQARRGRLVECS